MSTALIVILATLAPGGVIVTILQHVRRENSRDHSSNSRKLDRIDEKLDRQDHRIQKIFDRIDLHERNHP